MKKIISFSLWGDSLKYLKGALENVKCQQQLFPGWICRFYCHSHINLKWINEFYKQGAEVVLKDEVPNIKQDFIHFNETSYNPISFNCCKIN